MGDDLHINKQTNICIANHTHKNKIRIRKLYFDSAHNKTVQHAVQHAEQLT